MPHAADSPHLRRFDQFELNLRTVELYKEGKRIKLQEQPCQVLAVLIEHPGELVTREELKKKLWPNDTFVDFDHGVNIAINKLRDALKDSADKPRFIETLPRRGYRWIAPVHSVDNHANTAQDKTQSSQSTVDPLPDVAKPKAEKLKRWKLMILSAGLVIATTAVLSSFRYRTHALSNTDTIVLADFENKTGEPVFDDTLKEGLEVALQQSPYLNIVSERTVAQTMKMMGHSPTEPLTVNLARDLCQRAGSKAMLAGSISALGSQYVIALNAINCSSGDVFLKHQTQANGKEEVLKVLGNEAATIRTELGESLAKVQKYDTPIEQATTPSFDALKAYSVGSKVWRTNGETAALPWFKRATELDPNFAMAYAKLGVIYDNLSEVGLGRDVIRKAYELRGAVSERERFAIEERYYGRVTGELEKAAQVSRVWRESYPNDPVAVANLGVIYNILGSNEKSLLEVQQAMRLDPSSINNYINLAEDYGNLNRLDDAEEVFKRADERHLESELSLAIRYQLAFLKADSATMARLAAAASGKAGAGDVLLSFEAKTEAWYGRLDKARELTQQAIRTAERNDSKETAAYYQVEEALREAEFGDRQRARSGANAALKLGTNRDVEAMAALALGRAGNVTRAEALVTGLDHDFPVDTLVQSYWLPSIRAAIELERKNPTSAIALLQTAGPYDLGSPTAWEGFLYPVYLRGEAYLQQRNGSVAAVEFQKFVDHRGLVVNFHLGALAQLGLARAYALQGDPAKARAAYEEFFALWKDADPDIPIFNEARSEYAKLR